MKTKLHTKTGQFARGASGNPGGRPLGSQNKSTLIMESMMQGDAEKLTRKLLDMASAGDIGAMRLCMERIMPPRKERLLSFELPPIENLDDISLGMKSILAAISEGMLTTEEGEAISRILGQHATVMVNQDLQQRVEKLERGSTANDNKVKIITNHQ